MTTRERMQVQAAAAPFAELRPPLEDAAARVAAERCLECGGPYAPAPCAAACPAEIDVPSFVTAIAAADPGRAAQTIFAENVLGGTCARVCPVEVLCEGACVLLHAGFRPVEIGRLQRFATDWAFERGRSPRFPPSSSAGRGRVAVIGAGPAGLACAAELAELGHRVSVYDARPEGGGLARYAIAPYRQQRDPLPLEVAGIERLGVSFHWNHPVDTPAKLREIDAGADVVFLGVGMGEDQEPGIPGERLPGVWRALTFIEALKTAEPPAVGEEVAVIGGGNTAIDVAREALRLGARRATVLYRRTEAEMPAYAHEVAEARAEGVHFLWLVSPVRFLGGDRLEGVECRYMRLGEAGAEGRRTLEPLPGTEFTTPASTVILAIGQKPRAEFLSWIDGLELERGRVRVDPETCRTGNPRYYAGGDAVSGGASVVQAVREGKLAARAIDAALRFGPPGADATALGEGRSAGSPADLAGRPFDESSRGEG